MQRDGVKRREECNFANDTKGAQMLRRWPSSSSKEPERKKRANTSSEERLKTSTPRAGSHTRPLLRIGPINGVPSGVSNGPVVDGEEVAIVSFDDIR